MEKIIDKSQQYQFNPRTISDPDLDRLHDHLFKYGDLSGVVYCRNNKAYVGGNQRSKVFDGSKIEIITEFDTPQEDRTVAIGFIIWNGRKYTYREVVFTEKEFREACIVANNDGGTWDMDVLKEHWDPEQLKDWGLDVDFVSEEFEKAISENTYTRKIESPVYEPKSEKPQISDLYNIEKTNKLIDDIKKTNLDNHTKTFLIKAAERHTIFNYEKIADFYAHSDDDVKKLMEDSALVIIDFDRAIELEYVKLSEEIREQYLEEYGDE